MLKDTHAFSGFSVDDLETAYQFYGEKLGLDAELTDMGLELKFKDGNQVFLYQKPDHQAATYTCLNFVVEGIDKAVEELASAGIVFEQYQDMTDEKGIARGKEAKMGPDIAWFKDPAGNILSVLEN